jgi:hypothetical protein
MSSNELHRGFCLVMTGLRHLGVDICTELCHFFSDFIGGEFMCAKSFFRWPFSATERLQKG